MAINLDRAEKIGGDNRHQSSITLDPNLKYGNIEVLTGHKIPFNKVSFIKDNYYVCPNCESHSIKMILDYHCTKCEARVIKWKCYVNEMEEKHPYYDSYIDRFYEATEVRMEMIRKKKLRETDG